MPGDSLDQLSYTKKKLSERPTKKKTHYFDKHDKKALAKGKNVQNAEVITPLEAHFEAENEKILVSENEASFLVNVIRYSFGIFFNSFLYLLFLFIIKGFPLHFHLVQNSTSMKFAITKVTILHKMAIAHFRKFHPTKMKFPEK